MREHQEQDVRRRWPSPDAFYRERDDRTARGVNGLEQYVSQPVRIVVDPDEAGRRSVQQIALTAANLTARWARHVMVVVPDVPLDPTLARDGHANLADRIRAEIGAADPFGDFRVSTTPLSSAGPSGLESSLDLFVGPWRSGARGGVGPVGDGFTIYATSWSAVGRRGGGFPNLGSEDATVAAAALSASLGAADLFKRAVGHHRREWVPSFAWCTWTHRVEPLRCAAVGVAPVPVPAVLDLGRTLLAGVGAIGSAIVYFADMMPLTGLLVLLDRDVVETSNLNRSPLFLATDCLWPTEKTAAAKRYLVRHAIDVRSRVGSFHEHAAELTTMGLDVWIALTNEEGAWAEIPYHLPPVVLQGTTTSGWGFGTGRHIPRREDCTTCRLPAPEAVFRGPCAEGDIQIEPEAPPVRAALPFLSAAAGALVLAELLKLGRPEVPTLPNEVSADLRLGLPGVVTSLRSVTPACPGCQALRMKAWECVGGIGRYANYSCE